MIEQPLIEDHSLKASWYEDYEAFLSDGRDAELQARLEAWAQRDVLNETASETAFIQRFFVDIWGYTTQGGRGEGDYTCRPQFEVKRAGQGGGMGRADLALGHFGAGRDGVPQVLCEFKDIRSGLDARQNRKDNTRSPVDQCFDYLQEAFQSRERDTLITPSWALVTDMQEFRLYSRATGKAQSQRFVLIEDDDPRVPALLGDSESAAFRRFVFWRIFQPDMLLAERGSSRLDDLIRDQIVHEKEIEATFYREYRAYRERVYHAIIDANPNFAGTRGKLVRLTQRFLDRCIFVLFCEDMGHALRYPPGLMRDLLIEYSNSKFYNPEGSAPWDGLRGLFRTMRDGGEYGSHAIDRFNGGLFEEDPELESLTIPAKVFCAEGQGGGGDATLREHPDTLLYFSAAYNFGVVGSTSERVIGLTTLGRIFEQSITELEIMEAEADGRVSINRLTKRKCDGVYYTPEWVTKYIVEHTVGTRFADIKAELGMGTLPPLDDAAIAEHRAFQRDKRRTATTAGKHRDFLSNYRKRLDQIKIVDPACGSGAFLIQALNRLVEEYRWVTAEQERIEGHPGLFDQDEVIRSILSHNIYGVDINPESIEITKLALWLHTAAPGKPLCALDHNIRCGNSLVGPDFGGFYSQKHDTLFEQADPNQRERVNAFDWEAAFPEVFSHGGFDCVVGNPPYIKLQHFRRAQADVAEYLTTVNRPDGSPVYESTRSGNFDMYLPFIEKGIALLRPEGRMGYIAPNVWMVNEYGKALRNKIKRTRALDRWLDFKSFQVFDEAITYTALQFFRGSPSPAVTCAFAPDGNTAGIEWDNPDANIPYDELPKDKAWNLMSDAERALIEKLGQNSQKLGDKRWTQQIFQGFKTSGDALYVAADSSPGRYSFHFPDNNVRERRIEVEIMFPVMSGAEAKRYEAPSTTRSILVPYRVDGDDARVLSGQELESTYPNCWAYLSERRVEFEAREKGRMIGSLEWWAYIYPKNLRQMRKPKLLVAGTAPELRVTSDPDGRYAFLGGRVYGILPARAEEMSFLLGVLNSAPVNRFFTSAARPKAGGFYDIETQFLAPLPIPDASESEKHEVGERALALQDLHTRRRDLVQAIDDRLRSGQTVPMSPNPGPDWLWTEVVSVKSWKSHPDAPEDLKGRELTAWAKARYEAALDARPEALDVLLQPGAQLTVENSDDHIA
ncbi:MAG: Eco57I restriction-modification methylase domain-containing protein, partial [Candidatus Pacebacteria bacterium]|nr:Eco57I restriction-modification methylase domain-containing protein [Candidatus Paceibacterota bacterium]